MRRTNRRKRSAFTLIEVLLVVGILALMAAFAVPKLFGLADQAKNDLAKTAVGRSGPIATALDAFNWDMGRYPTTDEGLAILLKKKGDVDDDHFKGPYLNNDRIADPFDEPFMYRSPGEVHQDSFDLWSKGKDRKDDGGKAGSDDIKNWTEK